MGTGQHLLSPGPGLDRTPAMEGDSAPNLTPLPPKDSRQMNTGYLEIWAELGGLLIETLALVVTNCQRIVTIKELFLSLSAPTMKI